MLTDLGGRNFIVFPNEHFLLLGLAILHILLFTASPTIDIYKKSRRQEDIVDIV